MAPLLLLPVVLLFATADAIPASCSSDTCGSQAIHYPFWLISSASDNCGYRGLGLACENDASLILSVQGHRYRVVSIDYINHTVGVADAELDEYGGGCPRLHSNFTGDDYAGSWLQLTPSNSNITFLYNCKKNVSLSSAVELSGCRGGRYVNKTSYVLPDGVITGTDMHEYECEEVVVAPVLSVHKAGTMGAPAAGKPSPVNGSFVGELVKAGFELMYHPNSRFQLCNGCERSGGWCGFRRYHRDDETGFTCYCDGGPTSERCEGEKYRRGMACARAKQQKPFLGPPAFPNFLHAIMRLLLLALLLAVSCHGAPSGDDLYDPSLCLWRPSTCGNVNIDYPFYLSSKTGVLQGSSNSSYYCGYPGLAIRCEDGNQAFLRLGNGTYRVSNIDYTGNTFSLVDPEVFEDERCPRVDHNVTLPQFSWLYYPDTAVAYVLFLLNCNFTMDWSPPKTVSPITCAKGPGRSFVLLQAEGVPDEDWRKACQRITVPVLKDVLWSDPQNHTAWSSGDYSNVLRAGFQLAWERERKTLSCNQCDGSYDYDPSLCLRRPFTCGSLTINYPFYVYNSTALLRGNDGSYCGYPGLAVRCVDGKKAVLQLGDSNYKVSNIDYTNKTVSLADQEVFEDERMSATWAACAPVGEWRLSIAQLILRVKGVERELKFILSRPHRAYYCCA
ncbi:hypothetical protein QOZ80_1AG0029190 [Eleusine coracana subsp. coracana]|nr:hypothetical protein QOZ80_1AG0029190 [Eleusine coracana subsp. coracana]